MARLDQLLQAERQRKEVPLNLLRSVVKGLDGVLPSPDEPGADLGDVARPVRRATAPSRPYVALPRRTTHGGRFGPAVVAKMRARALR
jgi:hypothetical protein